MGKKRGSKKKRRPKWLDGTPSEERLVGELADKPDDARTAEQAFAEAEVQPHQAKVLAPDQPRYVAVSMRCRHCKNTFGPILLNGQFKACPFCRRPFFNFVPIYDENVEWAAELERQAEKTYMPLPEDDPVAMAKTRAEMGLAAMGAKDKETEVKSRMAAGLRNRFETPV